MLCFFPTKIKLNQNKTIKKSIFLTKTFNCFLTKKKTEHFSIKIKNEIINDEKYK